MAILKRLNEYSYILETETKEKIGIVVDYGISSTEKSGIEFFNAKGRMAFESIDALSKVIGDKIKMEDIVVSDNESTKFIDEYPVNDTDSVYDIQEDLSTNLKTFSKSTRSKKRFYPGWWILKATTNDTPTSRLTISVDTFNEKELNTTIFGPFKSHMEVTHQLKKL